MKSRKKLISLLLCTMLFSSMSISNVQAASLNSLSKSTIKVNEGHIFYDKATANALKINFNTHSGEDEVFYLELEHAIWSEEALTRAFGNSFLLDGVPAWSYEADGGMYSSPTVIYAKQSDTCMQVLIDGEKISDKARYGFPLLVEMTGGSAKVNLKYGRTASKGTWTFASAESKPASWGIGAVGTIGTEGKLADLRLTESYAGAMSEEVTRVALRLDNDDYFFEIEGDVVSSSYDRVGYTTYKFDDRSDVEFLNGFFNRGKEIYILVNEKDKSKAEIVIPEIESDNTFGTILIKNLYVKTRDELPTTGNLQVKITSDQLSNSGSSISMANIENYGMNVAMIPAVPVTIPAGQVKDITFSFGEKIDESLRGNRTVTFTLDYGQFDYRTLLTYYGTTGKSPEEIAAMSNEEVLKLSPKLNLDELKVDRHIQLMNNLTLISDIAFDRDSHGNINPSRLIATLAKGIESNGKIDKVNMKMPVYIPIENRELESVNLTVEGQAVEGSVTIPVVKIKNPFNIVVEGANLQVSKKDQVGGKIIITEMDKGMFQQGEILFKLEEEYRGMKVKVDGVDIHSEGGLKGLRQSMQEDDCLLALVTLNQSKEMGAIVIEMNKITVDGTVPSGNIGIKIGGSAMDAYGSSVLIEDFIKIIDKEEGSLEGDTISPIQFTIGDYKCTIGDKVINMDVTPYIEAPGYTMVPIRYVLEAFNIEEKDIMYDNEQGTVTLFVQDRIIQFNKNSTCVNVNGNPINIEVCMLIKDGRSFIPVSEFSKLLGVKASWDSETKTATFTTDMYESDVSEVEKNKSEES